MPPPPVRRTLGGNASAPLTSLPDDLVEEIFLRLPTATDLARASTACASFRRIIAGHFFLRRALHPPPLLGVLAYDSAERKNLSVAFLPAQPPHPCAAAAALTLAAADFSCSFLPSPELWSTCDFRDGRALFSKQGDVLANLAVCDPLHRRYLLLPAIPHDLAVLAWQLKLMYCGPFLAPAGENEGDSANAPSGFRVMCLRMSSTKLVLFSSIRLVPVPANGTVTFDGWSALIARYVSGGFFRGTVSITRHYAHGCFYWQIPYTGKLLMLDTLMEFSSPSPPLDRYLKVFVEAREGRLGMISHGIYGDCLLYDIL